MQRHPHNRLLALGVSLVLLLAPQPVRSADLVPQGWRGTGTGVFPAEHPPVKWSPTENIAWFTPLPSWSNAQPVVVGDKVFVLSEPDLLLCLNRADGRIVWERTIDYRTLVGEAGWPAVEAELQQTAPLRERLQQLEQSDVDKTETPHTDEVSDEITRLKAALREFPLAAKYTLPVTHDTLCGYTTATPTANAEFVWAVLGNGIVACFDHAGQRQWMVRLDDRPHKMWGHSASPLLIGDRLFVNIDSLTALNARTGAELWRKKYNQCWGSTQAIRVGDVDVLVLGNGKFVRATDGQVLARAMTPSNVSPIIHGRKVYFIQDPAQAVEVPEALGATLELKTLWEREVRGGTVFASPVLHRGLLWSLSASGVLNVLDAETGKLIKNRRLDFGSGKVYPSLTVAGDYLYASHDSGATAVLRADESAEEIGRNHLDSFMSTPLCHDSQLLIRTRSGLYCIGQKR